MLAFKLAIVDQCQCILLCVRILLANLPPFSTTSETLSYVIYEEVGAEQGGVTTIGVVAGRYQIPDIRYKWAIPDTIGWAIPEADMQPDTNHTPRDTLLYQVISNMAPYQTPPIYTTPHRSIPYQTTNNTAQFLLYIAQTHID